MTHSILHPTVFFAGDADLHQPLKKFVRFANQNWFPIDFCGSSPMEFFKKGSIDRNQFTEKIKLAQKQRVVENRNFSLRHNNLHIAPSTLNQKHN